MTKWLIGTCHRRLLQCEQNGLVVVLAPIFLPYLPLVYLIRFPGCYNPRSPQKSFPCLMGSKDPVINGWLFTPLHSPSRSCDLARPVSILLRFSLSLQSLNFLIAPGRFTFIVDVYLHYRNTVFFVCTSVNRSVSHRFVEWNYNEQR